jgi:phospholipid/cholesterol/gamma-HCH transport system substrate-binding protein
MQRSTLDLWVGLFVVAGIGALLVLALKVGNMSGASIGQSYKIVAQFENIGGLKPRAPVKSAGVVVGRVSAIQFNNEKNVAQVTINLDKTYQFSKDTTFSILTSGLLGEQYIGLEAGGAPANLQEGDVVPVKFTQSAMVLEKLIGQFLFSKAAEGGDKK